MLFCVPFSSRSRDSRLVRVSVSGTFSEQKHDVPQQHCDSRNGTKGRTSEVDMACLHSARFGQKWESVKVSVKGMILSGLDHYGACFITVPRPAADLADLARLGLTINSHISVTA